MTRPLIDLVSDTATQPSPAMLQAISAAATGDEQRGEDPTTRALEDRVAALLGQEQGLFLPSGTMANQISFLVHCRPGDEIICAENAHVFGSEGAGAAALAGAQFRPIDVPSGIFTADQAAGRLRAPRDRSPRSRVISVEQTTNRGGGQVWPLEALTALRALADQHGLALHMDGARLLDAAVAAGLEPSAYAALCDSVWIDLSKSLGCPFGSVLTGSSAFIAEAHVWKHRLGGAMRQSGLMAAAGLYALDHNVSRLAEDHARARRLAQIIAPIQGLRVVPETPQTNIVILDLAQTGIAAPALHAALLDDGVRLTSESPTRLRAVTHLDIDDEMIETAGRAILAAAAGLAP